MFQSFTFDIESDISISFQKKNVRRNSSTETGQEMDYTFIMKETYLSFLKEKRNRGYTQVESTVQDIHLFRVG